MATEEGKAERRVYERPFTDPPAEIVRDGKFVLGCFNGPAARANMLDIERPYHYRVPRWVKAARCKEWRAFQFGDSRFFFFSALYEAKSFGLALFFAWDRESRRAYEIKRMIPFRSFGIGERIDGEEIGFKDRHASIAFSTPLKEGVVLVEAGSSSKRSRGGFSGSFRFAYNPRQTAPSTVCLPLGLNRAMYSTKVLMPMEGWFEADDERYEFVAADAMGIMDDHKGFYPFHMRYDWVTGYGIDSRGRRVGFNLTDNQVRDQAAYNENVLWVNSRAFPLPPVKVTRPQGTDGVWHIQDTEGLVDLLFKPERRNTIKVDALFFAADYHGPFGSFEGILRSPDGGEKIDAKTLYGMGEKKYLRA